MGFDYYKTRREVKTISLNDLLDQLEVDVSRVGQGKMENAQNLLVKMDEAQQRIADMVQKELQVKAESAQFDYLVSELEKNARKLLNDLGGTKQLESLRKKRPSGQDFDWWHVDAIYARQQKKNLSRILISAGSGGLLLVLFIVVYNVFLKPDPAVSQKYAHQMNAEQSLAEGDYAKALSEINLALEFGASDADLLVIRGVTQTKLGNQEQATQDFKAAEASLGSHTSFLLLRSQYWLEVNDYQNSLTDSQEVIQEDPASAEGYFFGGRANEMLGNYDAAVKAYETASNLADSQGKIELNASIRIYLAMLMQTIPGMQPTTQQTPNP
jgi:tetratricopeptide (TPR) repeat protein